MAGCAWTSGVFHSPRDRTHPPAGLRYTRQHARDFLTCIEGLHRHLHLHSASKYFRLAEMDERQLDPEHFSRGSVCALHVMQEAPTRFCQQAQRAEQSVWAEHSTMTLRTVMTTGWARHDMQSSDVQARAEAGPKARLGSRRWQSASHHCLVIFHRAARHWRAAVTLSLPVRA